MNITQVMERTNKAREIADRINEYRRNKARTYCELAGLDPNLLGIHPHNAMVSYNAGKPWPNVDYHYVRKCRWMLSRQFEPYKLVDKLYSRLIEEARATGWE